MKRNISTLFIIIIIMTFLSGMSYSMTEDNYIRMISSDKGGFSIEMSLPQVEFLNELHEGNIFKKIDLPDWGITTDVGKPELPVLSRIFAMPNQSGVSFNFEILEEEIISGLDMLPLQPFTSDNPEIDTPPFTIDQKFYSENKFYPEKSVTVSDPGIMRDLRIAQINFAPFSYNPATKELRVIKKMRADVQFTGDNVINPKTHQRSKHSDVFSKVYMQSVINYGEFTTDDVTERGGYIIVVPSTTIAAYIDTTLAEWKREKGFPVTIVSTSVIGTSKESIRTYISNAYYNWDIPPEFVILVGDQSGSVSIATDNFNNGWGDNSVTDHYYAKLEGSDYFPDIMVGRLSVQNTTQLQTVINKLLYYESNPSMTLNWYTRALMIADYSNISCKMTKQYIKSRCLDNGYTAVDTVWFSYPSAPITTIANSINNNGVGIVNFRGYLGWGGWDSNDIMGLNNGGKLPTVFGCTCETGSFEISNCISEAWLRAGTPSNPKGGIGCVGPSSWNTHTRFNNGLDSGFARGLLDEGLEYYMQVIIRGKLELWNGFPYNHYGNNTSSVESYYHTYNLIGDPGTSLWTMTPRELVVDAPSDIPLGTNFYPVSVEDNSGNPIEGVYVNLWKGNEVYVGGYTDENGSINLPISPATAGPMKLCVSGRNYFPERDTVQVISGEMFLGVAQIEIDDDNVPPSSGNGDGVLNPGETIELNLQIQNFGSVNVNGVTGELSVDYPFITITTPSASFGNINGGSSAWSSAPMILQITPDCPRDEYIEFGLTISDEISQEWESMLALEIESADFTARSYSLPQAGTNRSLDPGETSSFIVTLENIGTYPSEALNAELICESEFVEILDNSGAFNSIPVGGIDSNSVNTFELHTPVDTYPGTLVDLIVVLSGASGYRDTVYVPMNLGVPNASDPMIPDSYGYYCYDDGDAGYSPAPVYQWIEVSGLTSSLNLPDYGDEQDCSIRLSFPAGFSFRYYGEEFTTFTVCSNGWASLGHTYMCNFRNWEITGAQVAPACIAPFWDDLRMISGGGTNGKVFAYYDEVNHKFIIEWNNVRNADGGLSYQTFEIILYDPIFYPTPSGDGMIDFQYQDVNNNGSFNNATVGIATPDNGDGVQYTFANQYPAGAPTLHDNMAIRFTTEGNVGYEPPVIGVDPLTLTINVPQSGSAFESLTISNTGASTLIYNITTGGLEDASGGPDQFGYSWIDSDEPTGPVYNWVDIGGIGTPVTFLHNDSTSIEFDIGFTFPFYGAEFDQFILSANGWLSFTSHSTNWNNTILPSQEAPFNLLSPFWDDLDPDLTGLDVSYWTNETDSLIVSFIEVPHFGTSVNGVYTFQIILTSNGKFVFQYQDLSGDYEHCTVGIQNGNGTDGLTVVCNDTYLHDNLAIEFTLPLLKAFPSSGIVAVNSSSEVDIFAYSYGLEIGTYQSEIVVESNDPVNPQIHIPVTIDVVPGAAQIFDLTLEPQNPPITIPANGGMFGYDFSLTNISGFTQSFDIWLLADLPGGTTYGPILLRTGMNLNPGSSLFRAMNQNVPANAPAGEYWYYANIGLYPDSVTISEGFDFVKSNVLSAGGYMDNWNIFGWNGDAIPLEFAFIGAYPNPFNPSTDLVFDLPENSRVNIRIFDILGRQAAVLTDGFLPSGRHTVKWNAENVSSGVYFMRLDAGKHHAVSKLLLVK